MTARPRPVTATVTKPRWMSRPSPQAIAYAKRHSLDSSGSTASLISVLDHDSYVSVPSEEEEEHKVCQQMEKALKMSDINNDNIYDKCYDEFASTRPKSSSNLSPWESWIIAKTKQEQQKKKKEAKERKEAVLKKKEEMLEKQMRLQKIQQRREEWIRQKNYEEKLRLKQERLAARNAKVLKQEEERRVHEKAERRYAEWMEAKKQQEKELKNAERLKKKQGKLETERKKAKADLVYRKWFADAKKRPRSAPSSYGYLAGKLTKYHDLAAYPAPSYINPIPWQDPIIPKPKTAVKRPVKKKATWNPDNYY